jgi:hypothetical protein
MKLPERIKQHKAESDSYAILQYKLRNLGIFRNVTESDYGVDFEVELISNGQVTGQYFKAQVKSSENLRIRKSDGIPTVGGVKESTLYYWSELSYKTHVILYAVDLKTEEIYISHPVFWHATRLINGDNRTKTVEFLKNDPALGDRTALFYTMIFARSPTLGNQIYAHRFALRYLKHFLALYVDVIRLDGDGEIHESDAFRVLLDVGRTLLFAQDWKEEASLDEKDRRYMFSYEYWLRNSGPFAGEVTNHVARKPVNAILPRLIAKLKSLRNVVFLGKYYWSVKDRPYLRLVYESFLPEDCSHETLSAWGYYYNDYQRHIHDFSYFLNLDKKGIVELEKFEKEHAERRRKSR